MNLGVFKEQAKNEVAANKPKNIKISSFIG